MDMYALFQIVQLLLRLLIYTFIGKGLLALLAGPDYRQNAIWRLFAAVTGPVRKATRRLLPRAVPERYIDLCAILLLLAVNLGMYMLFYSQGWIVPPRAPGGTPTSA